MASHLPDSGPPAQSAAGSETFSAPSGSPAPPSPSFVPVFPPRSASLAASDHLTHFALDTDLQYTDHPQGEPQPAYVTSAPRGPDSTLITAELRRLRAQNAALRATHAQFAAQIQAQSDQVGMLTDMLIGRSLAAQPWPELKRSSSAPEPPSDSNSHLISEPASDLGEVEPVHESLLNDLAQWRKEETYADQSFQAASHLPLEAQPMRRAARSAPPRSYPGYSIGPSSYATAASEDNTRTTFEVVPMPIPKPSDARLKQGDHSPTSAPTGLLTGNLTRSSTRLHSMITGEETRMGHQRDYDQASTLARDRGQTPNMEPHLLTPTLRPLSPRLPSSLSSKDTTPVEERTHMDKTGNRCSSPSHPDPPPRSRRTHYPSSYPFFYPFPVPYPSPWGMYPFELGHPCAPCGLPPESLSSPGQEPSAHNLRYPFPPPPWEDGCEAHGARTLDEPEVAHLRPPYCSSHRWPPPRPDYASVFPHFPWFRP